MHKLLNDLLRNTVSLISALWVTANLCFWILPLLLLSIIKFTIHLPLITHACNAALEFVYRTAVQVDSFWMLKVVGIRVNIHGELPDHPAPIIVCNHQTWFDIPVIQHTVTYHGPILKFLIKRQLLWVPIIGWICYALNFPRLNRGLGDNARKKDYTAIQAVSSTLEQERGALLIFAEGTRFTKEKHSKQNSPYKYLLKPKPGGLKIAIDTAPADTPVLDITVVYVGGETGFWKCLNGTTKNIEVIIKSSSVADIRDARDWIEASWAEKDSLIAQHNSENSLG